MDEVSSGPCFESAKCSHQPPAHHQDCACCSAAIYPKIFGLGRRIKPLQSQWLQNRQGGLVLAYRGLCHCQYPHMVPTYSYCRNVGNHNHHNHFFDLTMIFPVVPTIATKISPPIMRDHTTAIKSSFNHVLTNMCPPYFAN